MTLRRFTTGNARTVRRMNEVVSAVNTNARLASPEVIKRVVLNEKQFANQRIWRGVITEGVGDDQMFVGTFYDASANLLESGDFVDVNVVCPVAELPYAIIGNQFLAIKKYTGRTYVSWFCIAIYSPILDLVSSDLVWSSHDFISSEDFDSDIQLSSFQIFSSDMLLSSHDFISSEDFDSDLKLSSQDVFSSGDILSSQDALSSGVLASSDDRISSGEIWSSDEEVSSDMTVSSGEIISSEVTLSSGDLLSSQDALSSGVLKSSNELLSSRELVSSGELLSSGYIGSSDYPSSGDVGSSDTPSSGDGSSDSPTSDAVSSEDWYSCPSTLTVTFKELENCSEANCGLGSLAAEDYNGTWTLSETSECNYLYTSGEIRIEVRISDTSGYIEASGYAFDADYAFRYDGDVRRGKKYANESSCDTVNVCKENSETGFCLIF